MLATMERSNRISGRKRPIHRDSHPQFQDHQRPQQVPMVSAPPMLRYKSFQALPAEPVSTFHVVTQHCVLDEVVPVVAEPLAHGRNESLLLSIDDVPRKVSVGQVAEECFRSTSGKSNVHGDPHRQLEDILVKKRAAGFQARRHARSVGLREIVVW